jgi:putative endonuclease
MGLTRRILGIRGEREAEKALKKAGYRIVERNFRSSFGEIDIIAMDGDVLAFIEVKTRSNSAYGGPKEAVDRRKQGKIVKSSIDYIARKWRGGEPQSRYDVVSVEASDLAGKALACEIIKDAFSADGLF